MYLIKINKYEAILLSFIGNDFLSFYSLIDRLLNKLVNKVKHAYDSKFVFVCADLGILSTPYFCALFSTKLQHCIAPCNSISYFDIDIY